MRHSEFHRSHRIGWLRAAVLGANDGIVSTASLVIGVAAAQADLHSILVSGTAGLVAGAMSMAAGEYVSVSSQVDTQQADLKRERKELAENHHQELQELTMIYVSRGIQPALARQVAEQLMAHDALGAHLRDELGVHEITSARPLQAAFTSALTFAVGAILPLLVILAFQYLPVEGYNQWIARLTGSTALALIFTVAGVSLLSLVTLGSLSAATGGSSAAKAVCRVSFWGACSMCLTAGIGYWFGTAGI